MNWTPRDESMGDRVELSKVRQQRDEALAALKIAESFIAKLEDDQDYTDGQIEALHAIRAAIAKLEPA